VDPCYTRLDYVAAYAALSLQAPFDTSEPSGFGALNTCSREKRTGLFRPFHAAPLEENEGPLGLTELTAYILAAGIIGP
jgi:hypothetical protein